jgi:intraflagellar transport protein 122
MDRATGYIHMYAIKFGVLGVSKFAVLYALAKQSRNLGAYKLARHVLEKIQGLVVPKRFKENVDLATLMIR